MTKQRLVRALFGLAGISQRALAQSHIRSRSARGSRRLAGLVSLALPGVALAAPQTPPTSLSSEWTLSGSISVSKATSAIIHPLDGEVYVLQRKTGADGLYRVEPDQSLTLLAAASQPAGLVADPVSGDLFVSEDVNSGVYRTGYGATGRQTWLSGFYSGDDDSMGMAIAPPDYQGAVLLAGEGLLAEFGWNQNPPGAWAWSTSVPEGEVLAIGDWPGVDYFVDCAIGFDRIWLLSDDFTNAAGGGAAGKVWELTSINTLVEVTTSEELLAPVAIAVDPVSGDLLIKDATGQRVVAVDPDTGSVQTIIAGFGFAPGGIGEWVGIDLAPDGGRMVVSDSGSSTVWVFARSAAKYCTPGTSASGCRAVIAATGSPSATAPSGFSLNIAGAEGNKDGLYFFGTNGRQASPWGSGTSFQCVVPPVNRAGVLTGSGTNGLCDGSFSQDLNALWCPTCPNPAKNPGAGAMVQAQLWYRDPLNTSNQTTSLSDAIEFTVQP